MCTLALCSKEHQNLFLKCSEKDFGQFLVLFFVDTVYFSFKWPLLTTLSLSSYKRLPKSQYGIFILLLSYLF